ncbi:MAG: hypothetical protein AABW88_00325 [Nanoarchaeota archaeon]
MNILKPLYLATALSLATGINSYAKSPVHAKKHYTVSHSAKPFKKTPVIVPSWLKPYQKHFEKNGARKESAEGIIITAYIESGFKYTLKEGRAGELGLMQSTPDSIEEVVHYELRNRLRKGNRTDEYVHKTIRPYLLNFSKQTLAGCISNNEWTHYWASRKIVGKIRKQMKKDIKRNMFELSEYKRLKRNHDSDSDFGSAYRLIGKLDVLGVCNEKEIGFRESMADAYHNAPERTKTALKHCGENFLQCNRLPTITKNRKFTSFYVPKDLSKQKKGKHRSK